MPDKVIRGLRPIIDAEPLGSSPHDKQLSRRSPSQTDQHLQIGRRLEINFVRIIERNTFCGTNDLMSTRGQFFRRRARTRIFAPSAAAPF